MTGNSINIKLINLLNTISELNDNTDIKNKKSLSSTPEDKNIDKLSNQIDIQQLQSSVSSMLNIYLPLIWDQCNGAKVQITDQHDDNFSCDIKLKLKDYGDINLSVILHDKNKVDLTFYTQTHEFKELIQANIQDLKKNINTLGLSISSTKLLDLKQDDNPYIITEPSNTNLNFKV